MEHESFEDNTHSFILKVWREGAAEGSRCATWRGHITHVPSGERRYLKDVDDITLFVASYLEEMDAKPDLCYRARQWLNRWKLLFRSQS